MVSQLIPVPRCSHCGVEVAGKQASKEQLHAQHDNDPIPFAAGWFCALLRQYQHGMPLTMVK